MNNNYNETKSEWVSERKLEWLQDYGCTFADLLEDEDGEFILSEEDNGSPGDDGYKVDIRRINLPDFDKEWDNNQIIK